MARATTMRAAFERVKVPHGPLGSVERLIVRVMERQDRQAKFRRAQRRKGK